MSFWLKLLSRLPLWVMYPLSDGLAWVANSVLGYRKSVILSNLQNSFPENTLAQNRLLSRKYFSHLADVIVESIRAASMSQTELRQRVNFLNPKVLTDEIAAGKSVLVLASHHGNWEWMLLAFSCLENVSIEAVYQPLSNRAADQAMLSMRSRFGATLIPMQQTMRQVIARRTHPKVFAMVADQTPRPEDKKLWVKFLNQDTPFFLGAEKIAKYLDCKVFFAGMSKIRRGYYQVNFTQIASPPYADDASYIVREFAVCTEQTIRHQPAFWLWSHKRWKYSKD